MLYIFLILFTFLLLIKIHLLEYGKPLIDFNQKETLPLRGILAVCVLLTHLCPYLVKESPLLDDFGLWGPPSVATFFLLAGYGLGVSFLMKGEDYLHGFFRKRLLRLLWPLLIMTIIFQGYKVYKGCFNWVNTLITPSPMSWFIYALVIWYVGYYLSFKIGKTLKSKLILIWCFTLLYLFITIYLSMNYFYISILPLPMAITFVFFEEKLKAQILEYEKIVWWIVIVVFIVVMGYAIVGQNGAKLPGWRLPVNIIVPWIIVYITYYLGGWKNIFTNFLGKISYEFYIVHGFIVMLLGHKHLFGMTGYLNSISLILLILGLTISTAWILSNLCAYINNRIK